MNILQKYDNQRLDTIIQSNPRPKFKAGDTLNIHVKIKDGASERIQIFQGLCIGIHNNGLLTTFKVRNVKKKVEKSFLLYSPVVKEIEVLQVGIVRRAKLYYIRQLEGKATRIKKKFQVQSK